MTKFDNATIKNLRREYQAAIDAVSKKYGLVGEMGRITYEDNEFRCKLTVTAPATLVKATLSNPMYNATGHPHPSTSYIGRSYKLRNSVYTITDMKSPGVFLAKNQNGRLFRIKADQLKGMIAI
jgi:hypothetical protein